MRAPSKKNREEAQSTTEYILLLAVIVGLFLVFLSLFKDIAPLLFVRIGRVIDSFFQNVDLHRFPFKR